MVKTHSRPVVRFLYNSVRFSGSSLPELRRFLAFSIASRRPSSHFVVARQLPLREAVDRAALLGVQAHLQLRIEPFALFLRRAADLLALLRAELCCLAKLCQLLRAPFADALAAFLCSKTELFGKLSTLLLQEHCVLGKNRVCAEKPPSQSR